MGEQGDSYAQFKLGVAYSKGLGVPRDFKQAVYWYQKAAEKRFTNAQLNLGLMYEKGQGVPLDYVEAHAWFNIAAFNGEDSAMRGRDILANKMSPEQIAEAKYRARKWAKNHK